MSCFVDGSPNAEVLIVGMSPGREELQADKPFVGGSGKLLWGLLKSKAGLSRADCYIINTIGDWPAGKNGDVTHEQLDEWWDRFGEALSLSKAKVILCLGGTAFYRICGLTNISEWRGYLLEPSDVQQPIRKQRIETQYKTSNKARGVKKGDPRIITAKAAVDVPLPPSVQWIIPTIHPAAVMRTGFAQSPALAADLGRVGRALRGELSSPRLSYVEQPAMLPGVALWSHQDASPAAVDIETRRSVVGPDTIERVGVATDHGTWTALWDDKSRALTQASFIHHTGPKIAHNIGFDAPRLAQEGASIPEPWWDTMYAALLLQPDLLKGLNGVSSLYLDRKRWKHLSADQPAYYNAQDASAELELYYVLREQLVHSGQLKLFEDTIMRAIPVFVEMTQRGVRLDLEFRTQWVAKLEERRTALLADWRGRAGDINPLSPHQLKDLLYNKLGLPEMYSKYGGVTTDTGSLKEMLGHVRYQQHRPVLELLMEIRDVSKQLETYAKVQVEADGKVHPSWTPAAKDSEGFGKGLAGTGRITSREPNFQNIPKEARRLYIPNEPGWVFIEADWSQIEARIIAALSGDKVLEAAIARGLHTANMEALSVDKTRAKNFFYGWSYGAGARTLRKTFLTHGFDITEAECKIALKKLEETYARTAQWRREVADLAGATHRLTNPFGRRRNFFRGSGDAPAALDFLPQSTAADCLWSVVRPLSDALRRAGGGMCGLIHDAILVECPAEQAPECARIMREHMEQEFGAVAPGFAVPAEFKSGPNWGELSPMTTI